MAALLKQRLGHVPPPAAAMRPAVRQLRPAAAPAGCRRPAAHSSRRWQQLQQQRQQQQWQRQPLVAVFAAAGEEGGLDPSIPAVDQDFDLLGAEVKKLQESLGEALQGCSIYLVGMMGTGKSTTGKMLANTLKYAFFDTDHVVELAHPGDTVADIFSKYGEEYFRNCESQVLKELSPYKNLVVATGGGAPTRPKNWGYMHNGVVVWLRGEPELLARRVVAQGIEKRPLLFGEGVSEEEAYDISLAKLNTLLDERTKFYENADVVVELRGFGKDEPTGAPAAVVMHRLMDAVHNKILATQADREARKQFTIERGGNVPTMTTKQAPNSPTAVEE